MSRPDYVRCVLTGMYSGTFPPGPGPQIPGLFVAAKNTWCGRTDVHEFVFQDPTHAALNGLQEGRLMACPECSDAIVRALQKGTYRP